MGLLLVSFRLPCGSLLVRFPFGFLLVCFWFAFVLVSLRSPCGSLYIFPFGFLLASLFWFPCGFLLLTVSFWFPFILVSLWFSVGFLFGSRSFHAGYIVTRALFCMSSVLVRLSSGSLTSTHVSVVVGHPGHELRPAESQVDICSFGPRQRTWQLAGVLITCPG